MQTAQNCRLDFKTATKNQNHLMVGKKSKKIVRTNK